MQLSDFFFTTRVVRLHRDLKDPRTGMDSKRVKFEVDSNEFNDELLNDFEEDGNDLDLDTIKASRGKPKGLKEFDSEGSESEIEEVQVDSTDSGEEGAESEHLEDDRQIPIEPFNLKGDREEGSFDSEGFYVKKYDDEADQDRWMANLTHSDIQKARKAHVESEQRRQERTPAPQPQERETPESMGEDRYCSFYRWSRNRQSYF